MSFLSRQTSAETRKPAVRKLKTLLLYWRKKESRKCKKKNLQTQWTIWPRARYNSQKCLYMHFCPSTFFLNTWAFGEVLMWKDKCGSAASCHKHYSVSQKVKNIQEHTHTHRVFYSPDNSSDTPAKASDKKGYSLYIETFLYNLPGKVLVQPPTL